MMVAARKAGETPDEVRYEFGLDRRFDRMLTIDKRTGEATPNDGRIDSAAGAIVSKVKRSWQDSGEFPAGVVFSS
jgi:hypothetical protein